MEGVKMGQYHYAVLLYLCSSAATGLVLPAESGSGSRSMGHVNPSKENPVLDSKTLNVSGGMGKGSYAGNGLNKQDEGVNPPIEKLNRDKFIATGLTPELASGRSKASFQGEADSRSFLYGSLEIYDETLDALVQSMKRIADYMKTKDDRGDGHGVQVGEDFKKNCSPEGI